MNTYPSTNVLDLLRLLGNLASGFIRNPRRFDLEKVLGAWIGDVIKRYGSKNVILNFLIKKVLLVSGRDLSDHILQDPPDSQGYIEGNLKKDGMSFLAPNALTISHDQQWQRLRPYNEGVLGTGCQHQYQQAFLEQVHRAFSKPVSNIEDIRKCMGQAMLGIVFGQNVAPERLIKDIQVLFSMVGNPIKRILLGRFETKRLENFYQTLEQLWEGSEASEKPCLLSMAHGIKPYTTKEELLQQIPHWMFTFTGSGTDLLARTLTLITSRPEVLERVRQEIKEAGSLEQASTIAKLSYLEACLLETGRLFPPVTRTFHITTAGDRYNNTRIPPDMEILHVFPIMQRERSLDPSTDSFVPQRWLDPSDQDNSTYSNLFLRGSRTCPGRDLILFVCKSAIAILLDQQQLTSKTNVLSRDPLPAYFPENNIQFVNP